MSSGIALHGEAENKVVFGLFGAGGFAREVMPFAIENLSANFASKSHLPFQVYYLETNPQVKEVNGLPLISEREFFEIACHERLFNIAIADSKARERISKEYIERGAKPFPLRAPNSTVYCNNSIGEGSIICANSVITSNAIIGRFFHSNIFSYVAHDCEIGDFVTFAPRVTCCGNVQIHNHAYIGACATIKQGSSIKPLVIGEGAIVGMGAVVTKDVSPFSTVIGNPARPHLKS